MTQTTIDQELQKSREAVEALREQDNLRAQADRLPQLIAEKRRQEAREQSERALEQAIAEAAPKFAALAERTPKLREQLQNLIASMQPLAAEIKQVQNELYMAGRPLQNAAFEYDRHHVGKQASRDDPDNGLPFELVTATLFDNSLAKAGASNPALELTPDGGLPEWARLLLRTMGTEIHYYPSMGSRYWRGRFF